MHVLCKLNQLSGAEEARSSLMLDQQLCSLLLEKQLCIVVDQTHNQPLSQY